jgi:transcriptional regulator with XRE-family HTH domain
MEWSQRLAEVVQKLGGSGRAASAAGVSARAIQKYVAGDSQPPFVVVAQLADSARVSLDWIASGRPPMRRGDGGAIDVGVLEECLLAIEEMIAETGERPPAAKLARLAVYLYTVATQPSGGGRLDPAEARRLFRLVS